MSSLLSQHFPIELVCFYAFALLIILSALMVILSKNPVQSALYLVLTFFASAGLWIMAEAEFLGLILVLVYVGAVMTLFLFVLMTIPFDNLLLRKKHWAYTISGIAVLALFTLLMLKIFTSFQIINFATTLPSSVSNTETIGLLLYTQYLFPFELAGLILLVAIVSAISLSTTYNRKKTIIYSKDQINVTAASRLKIIKMASEPKKPVEQPND